MYRTRPARIFAGFALVALCASGCSGMLLADLFNRIGAQAIIVPTGISPKLVAGPDGRMRQQVSVTLANRGFNSFTGDVEVYAYMVPKDGELIGEEGDVWQATAMLSNVTIKGTADTAPNGGAIVSDPILSFVDKNPSRQQLYGVKIVVDPTDKQFGYVPLDLRTMIMYPNF